MGNSDSEDTTGKFGLCIQVDDLSIRKEVFIEQYY